jgi:formate dehydrogenase (NADP+) beta subunit
MNGMKTLDALKVIDCQWACPAHTPVPEYIRLVAEGRYNEAYSINRDSNVFPGVLGRVCDRPCEPACRRSRVDEEPVAICRLKRTAADYRTEVSLPKIPVQKSGRKVALIGCGPASLTVANDLCPMGHEIHIFEKSSLSGGAMRFSVPLFRLPTRVLDEEIGYILNMGVKLHLNRPVNDISELYDDFDAVFVGSGAPIGKDLPLPNREKANVLIGLDWLKSVAFGHEKAFPQRCDVIVIGGGNTAMDCARTAKRLGASSVQVIAPESFDQMLASPWEIKDCQEENIPILNNLLPESYLIDAEQTRGMRFTPLSQLFDSTGQWNPTASGEKAVDIAASIIILAIGQKSNLPFIDPITSGVKLNPNGTAVVDETTLQSTHPKVFFGGDSAFGPKNIIWAVAHGHQAAWSIDRFMKGMDLSERPLPNILWDSQKMGIKEWSYKNQYTVHDRVVVPHIPLEKRFDSLEQEVELGFDPALAKKEAARCLNCDVQTIFSAKDCIECDACVDICPTDCLSMSLSENDLKAPRLNLDQVFFKSTELPQTARFMFKDENLCTHCGLCAERCPTGAWDMQKSLILPGKLDNAK